MNCTAILFLLIIILVVWILIKYNNTSIKESIENFTAISGIEQPLTTYDDYGTFNFLLQTDDLPYYDPTYENLGDDYRDYDPDGQKKTCGLSTSKLSKNENFNKDSFIDYHGLKVRRELVPSNYNKNNMYADADFDRNQLHLCVRKNRPRESAYPPQPHNIYFNKTQRVYPYNW